VAELVTRLNARDADVIVTSTAPFGAQVPIMTASDARELAPILNSWAGDGYWYPPDPRSRTAGT
jgi:hypothetical protein